MLQSRLLRAAEYFGRATSAARVVWGDKGEPCVVHALHWKRSMLSDQARATAAVDDAAPLWLEAQRLVAECRRILNARLSANTCLVERCFAVEEDFYVRYNVMLVEKGRGVAALTSEQRESIRLSLKRRVGYKACIETAHAGLQFA